MLVTIAALSLYLAVPTAPLPMSLRPCTVEGSSEKVRCGDLLVPENPSQREGRHIKIHFVVIPAVDVVAGRAPLFDLAGGPGISATNGASYFLTEGKVHRQNRDVVLVDQRGTGESSPLRCPELELTSSLERMYPPLAVQRCRKTLSRHVDLSQYNTENSVADLEAVREALGYQSVDLFGLSYGTRLALAYIELFPRRVRSAVLMGVVPADAKMPLWHARNAQRTLDEVFSDCAASASCRATFPDLRKQWKRLEENPAFDGPAREAFRTLLLSPDSQRGIPLMVQSMSGGDLTAFRKRFDKMNSGMFAEGLYLSVICSEDTYAITAEERTSAAARTFLGKYRVDEQVGACKEWNVSSRKLAYGAKRHDVPLLVIAGDRDYVTPVEWSNAAAATASRSRLVVVPRMGHMPDGLTNLECIDQMTAAFYQRANVADVDSSCVSKIAPPPFALTPE